MVLALPPRPGPEVLVAGLDLPKVLTPGGTADLVARIESTGPADATLEVFVDGFRLGEPAPVKIKRGENRVASSVQLPKAGAHEYAVTVTSDNDTTAENNRAAQVAVLPGEVKVLVVEEREEDARFLARALRDAGLAVDVRTSDGFPSDIVDLDGYACVVLSDVPATSLLMSQMKMLKSYVEDLGGGFVMVGGESSFGLGGYFRTPVEEILPVRLDVDKKKEEPTLAMMIVLDKSGSMEGKKVQLAKEASLSTLDLLGADDLVGVVTFDTNGYLVSPIGRAANRSAVTAQISGIVAGGGTNMYPALEIAHRELNRVQARVKHVILLTDGKTHDGDYAGLVRRMVADGLTVSCVAVGNQADVALLQGVSRWGRGRFYYTRDVSSIPQIFARETATASKSAVVEEPFQPRVVRDVEAVRGIDFAKAPYLLGYVSTKAKPLSEVILASERAEPVLVRWRTGLGKAAAFTSDAKNRWSAEWLSWPGFGKFWAQVIRDTMRATPSGAADVRLEFDGDAGTVTVDAADVAGRFRNRLVAEASVIAPQGDARRVKLAQEAPGRYRGTFPAPRAGTYVVSARLASSGAAEGASDVVVVGRVKPGAAEFATLDTDRAALARLAHAAGGEFIDAPEWAGGKGDAVKGTVPFSSVAARLAAPARRSVSTTHALWPIFLWSALALFFIDLACRRIDFRSLVRRQAGGGTAPPTFSLSPHVSPSLSPHASDSLSPHGGAGARASHSLSPHGGERVRVRGGLLLLLLLLLPLCSLAPPPARAETPPPLAVPDAEVEYLSAKRVQTLNKLTRVLLSERKTAEARAALEPEVSRLAARGAGSCSVDEVRLVFLMGIVEEMSGAPAKRDELFKAARRLAPADEATHFFIGRAFEDLHREDIAGSELRAVVDMPPDDSPYDAEALRRLGSIAETSRRYAAAADLFERLLTLLGTTRHPAAREETVGAVRAVEYGGLVCRAHALLDEGKGDSWPRALEKCEAAWRLDPERIDAAVLGEKIAAACPDKARAGELKTAWRKRSDDVAEFLRGAIRASPRDATNYNALAWFCAESGRDYDEGLRAARRALDLRPAECAFLDTLAEVQFKSGDAPAAAATIRRVTDLYPWANDYYRRQLERFEAAVAKPKAGAP